MEHVVILGANAQSLYDQIRDLIDTYGFDADVENVIDEKLAVKYGITNLPIIILDGDVITTGPGCSLVMSTLVLKKERVKRVK